MRKLIHFLFFMSLYLAADAQFACSGLDRVDIYLSKKLIATATAADAPVIKLDKISQPDTLLFHAFTNWEGLRNCTLDVETDYGELIDHVNSGNNTGYEAIFTYVFDRANLDDPDIKTLDIYINLLCERDVVPELIGTISLVPK
jgi:hypothetical protein